MQVFVIRSELQPDDGAMGGINNVPSEMEDVRVPGVNQDQQPQIKTSGGKKATTNDQEQAFG